MDSACIGIVPLELCDAEELQKTLDTSLGAVYTFKSPVKFDWDEGLFSFTSGRLVITIDTRVD